MDIRVEYSGAACVFLALLCLLLPLDWLLAALTAAAFHELCHVMAIFLAGGSVHSLQIGPEGALMEASAMEPWRELACVLAGPLGSFSLLLLSEFVPKIGLCGFVQGSFNLIPLYPLDGGRALSCAMEALFLPDTAQRICSAVKWAVVILASAAGFWGTFVVKMGIMPLLLAVFFLSRALPGKIPCKAGKLGVQ